MTPTISKTPLRALAAATVLATSAVGAHAQALKLAHITPPTHVWHQVSERFAGELNKASGGKMTVAVSPLQKLGNEGQVTQLMQAGAVQFAVFTAAGLSNREESLLGWSLPYVFKDVAHASRAGTTLAAKEMLKRLEASGLVGLGYTYAGMRWFHNASSGVMVLDGEGRVVRRATFLTASAMIDFLKQDASAD